MKNAPIPTPGFNDAASEILFLRDVVRELVRQHCKSPSGGYFSGFIGVNAAAMRYLGRIGMMSVADCGGRVADGEISPGFEHCGLEGEPDYPEAPYSVPNGTKLAERNPRGGLWQNR